MSNSKTVILIDGGFFAKVYKKFSDGSPLTGEIVQRLVMEIEAAIARTSSGGVAEPIFRIFFYDCPPFKGKEIDPSGKVIDYSRTVDCQNQERLLKDLKKAEKFALRLGEVKFRGWKYDDKGNVSPDFRQKAVDMKIGLDIAWMAAKKSVDRLVLVAGDADFISPMKLARREGIWVYTCELFGNTLIDDICEHSDFILPIKAPDFLAPLPEPAAPALLEAPKKPSTHYMVSTHIWDMLSRYYCSEFLVDGEAFVCVEQYVQYQKSIWFGDNERANRILGMGVGDNFYELKDDKIESFDKKINAQWADSKAYIAIYEAYKHQILQNDEMYEYLMKIEASFIAERGVFYLYTTGLKEDDPDFTNESKWTGKNYVGKSLQALKKVFSEK